MRSEPARRRGGGGGGSGNQQGFAKQLAMRRSIRERGRARLMGAPPPAPPTLYRGGNLEGRPCIVPQAPEPSTGWQYREWEYPPSKVEAPILSPRVSPYP